MSQKHETQDFELLAQQEAQAHLDMIARGVIGFEQAVGELADRGAAFGVGAVLARTAGVPLAAAVRALLARADEPALVVCRAAGLRTDGYSAVLRMRRRRLLQPWDNAAEALAGYHRLPQEMAKRLLPFLRLSAPDSASE
jgi:hypothetical protein